MGIIYHAAIRCLKVKDTTQVNTDINDGLSTSCDYIEQAKKNISKINRMVKIEGARKGTLRIKNYLIPTNCNVLAVTNNATDCFGFHRYKITFYYRKQETIEINKIHYTSANRFMIHIPCNNELHPYKLDFYAGPGGSWGDGDNYHDIEKYGIKDLVYTAEQWYRDEEERRINSYCTLNKFHSPNPYSSLIPAQYFPFTELPWEIKEKIILYLDKETLLSLQKVSKKWNTNKVLQKLEKFNEEEYKVIGIGIYHNEHFLFEFDSSIKDWNPMKIIPSSLDLALYPYYGSKAHIHTYEQKIYIIGIMNCHTAVYNTKNNEWKTLSINKHNNNPPMWGYQTVMIGPRIYIIGGQDENGYTTSKIAVINTKDESWETVSNMSTPRLCCGAIAHESKIYIIGGENEFNGNILKTAEIYDPSTNKCETLPNMVTPRIWPSLFILNKSIIVSGGLSNPGCLSNIEGIERIEALDPETRSWKPTPGIPCFSGRINFINNNTLYIANENMPWTEEYTIQTFKENRWQETKTMQYNFRISATCTIPKKYINRCLR